jgi:FkbM family methyltransferase
VKTTPVRYFGETVHLPDLARYRKFYRKLEAGEWEPDTFATLRRHLDKETVYVDVGGWIGVTPLWASRLAKEVIIVEPDPACRAVLRELCPAYSNVTLIEGALSPAPLVTLSAIDGFGSSEATALALGSSETVEAPGHAVGEIMRKAADAPLFVKIDIEGYELSIAQEIGRFADYRLKAMQCAVHPGLYERSLLGSRVTRRGKTLLALARLAGIRRGLSVRPPPTKYPSMFSYLVFGVLLRAVPKGADLVFTPRNG